MRDWTKDRHTLAYVLRRHWKSISLAVCVLLLMLSAYSHARFLESPAPGAHVSGIGFISGWKCGAQAQNITVRINEGDPIPLLTGVSREDTRRVCGTVHNGFITQVNWNWLRSGTYTAVAYADGIEFARSTFTAATTGEEFLEDVAAQCTVSDFPAQGENGLFTWNESTQHLELEAAGDHVLTPSPPCQTRPLARFAGKWEMTVQYLYGTCDVLDDYSDDELELEEDEDLYWALPFTISTNTAGDTVFDLGLIILAPTGHLEGSYAYQQGGWREASVSGQLEERTGTGTWFNANGCQGRWTAEKR